MANLLPERRSLVGWKIVVVTLGPLLFFAVILPAYLISQHFLILRAHRQEVTRRLQVAGGWEALMRDCVLLAQTNEYEFQWRGPYPDAPKLPPALVALKPKRVRYFSPKALAGSGQPQVPVIHIQIFGTPRSGRGSTPYFGLEVIAGPDNKDYRPEPAGGQHLGNAHVNYRKVTNGIYEIF